MRKNLVLLGMMGVGKSTLGKIVAKKCGIKFIDTDLLIEKKNFMSVKEIFEKKGENFFRKELDLSTSVFVQFMDSENPYKNKKNTLTDRQKKRRKRIVKRRK